MKELYIAAVEDLATELEREPTEAEAEAAYLGAIERLYDRTDNLRKAERENGQ